LAFGSCFWPVVVSSGRVVGVFFFGCNLHA
jgi:hypothetical protein